MRLPIPSLISLPPLYKRGGLRQGGSTACEDIWQEPLR
jgi:hypothetical protein